MPTSIHISDEIINELDKIAKAEDLTRAQLIRRAIRNLLKEMRPQKEKK